MDVKRIKVTNHSNRSSAVSNLAKSGVGEHQITKITGHTSVSSINSYLKLDEEHQTELISKMRNESLPSEATSNKIATNNYYKCVSHYSNK